MPLPDSELLDKVIERVELMAGIKFFIIFSVTALHLAVMPRREGADLLVLDTKLCQCFLKECQRLFLTVSHFVCELEAIVCLDTFNGIGELLYHMLQKLSGRIGSLLLEGFQVAETAVFIYEGVLIIFFPSCFSNQAVTRDIFHIYLYSLPRIPHFLIRFGNIFRVWQLDGLSVDPAQELI